MRACVRVCVCVRVCAFMRVYGACLVINTKGMSPEIQAVDRILLRGLENSTPPLPASGGGVKGHPSGSPEGTSDATGIHV